MQGDQRTYPVAVFDVYGEDTGTSSAVPLMEQVMLAGHSNAPVDFLGCISRAMSSGVSNGRQVNALRSVHGASNRSLPSGYLSFRFKLLQ